jgi:hypothetical protein
MYNLGQFFQDDGTKRFSATRLAFLAWIFGALVIWGADSFQNKEMQKVPDSVTTLIGILMTGKVAQKFGEKKGSNSSESLPTDGAKSTADENGSGVAKTSVLQR